MIEADVIEPWDNYIPKDVLDDIIPSIREENTIDGKLYGWPFLLDVIGTGWHSGLTTKAGLPDTAPATWDDYLANAKTIVDSGAAPFGATFDAHGWRSLAPMTHSMSTNVYTSEGLFDFTSDAAVEALMLMKKIMAVSQPGHPARRRLRWRRQRHAGRGRLRRPARRLLHQVLQCAAAHGPELGRPEAAAPRRRCRSSPMAKARRCSGRPARALFKYGKNKEKAAEYIKALTYDPQIWKDSIAGTEDAHPGQLPPYKSIYADWDANKPDWMPPFVALVRGQLDKARAINNHVFGLQQFVIGKPIWETYLKGEEADPKAALQKVVDAVQAEIKRG